jgi:transcriptional regulator with XRE-family HTH domain
VALPVDTAKFRFRDNGRKIRQARRLTGLSQENFAPLIGTGRRHMIKLENGEHRPSGELRDRIVEVTGTKEQIESSDDDKEEEVFPLALLRRIAEMDGPEISAFDLLDTVDEKDVQRYRRSALHSLVQAAHIEKELACRGS